jgi:hypothetical protein
LWFLVLNVIFDLVYEFLFCITDLVWFVRFDSDSLILILVCRF